MRKKRKLRLTERQINYRKNRLLGMNQLDAAIAAGYSYSMASKHSIDIERRVRPSIIDEFNRAGATDRTMVQKLTELALSAKKIQSCTLLVQKDSDGKLKINESSDDFIEVPDNHLRKETWELIAKLKKQLTTVPTIGASASL